MTKSKRPKTTVHAPAGTRKRSFNLGNKIDDLLTDLTALAREHHRSATKTEIVELAIELYARTTRPAGPDPAPARPPAKRGK